MHYFERFARVFAIPKKYRAGNKTKDPDIKEEAHQRGVILVSEMFEEHRSSDGALGERNETRYSPDRGCHEVTGVENPAATNEKSSEAPE